jgi:hypothetical protein
MGSPTFLEEHAATMQNLNVFNIEAFSLLGIAVLVTVLRCYVRISTVGCRNLWADDYLVILAVVSLKTLSARSMLTDLGDICYRNRSGLFCREYRPRVGE